MGQILRYVRPKLLWRHNERICLGVGLPGDLSDGGLCRAAAGHQKKVCDKLPGYSMVQTTLHTVHRNKHLIEATVDNLYSI